MTNKSIASKGKPASHTYRLNHEDQDRLHELSMKLHALLAVTYGGESGDGFRSLNNGIQDAYMWACSDMAAEIRNIIDTAEVVHARPRKA